MKPTVHPIPEGYRSVTPYLIAQDCAKAIDFYKKAFSAIEIMRIEAPGGKVGHAELEIGDSKLMIADECAEMEAKSARSLGGSPIGIHLYVEDVDSIIQQALEAGAKLTRPIENMFYGDRSGEVRDPEGYKWHIASHVEDVSPEELKKRMDAMSGGKP